jgi:hypothetical protein
MGKMDSVFGAGFSGRVGNVVGYEWRGRQCVRSLPKDFHDAKTPMQLEQRSLFKQTVAFAGRAKDVLHLGLSVPSRDIQMTECNYFMRLNKRCFSLVDGVLKVDFAELVVSDGPVAPVAFGAVRVVDDRTLAVDFEKNPLHRVASSDDKVYLAAFCPDLNSFALSQPSRRGAKSVEMNFLSPYSGKGVHLWGFVVDRAGRASLSEYLGYGLLDPEATEYEEDTDAFAEDGTGDVPLMDVELVRGGDKPRASAGRMPALQSGNPPDI